MTQIAENLPNSYRPAPKEASLHSESRVGERSHSMVPQRCTEQLLGGEVRILDLKNVFDSVVGKSGILILSDPVGNKTHESVRK